MQAYQLADRASLKNYRQINQIKFCKEEEVLFELGSEV